MDSDYLGLMQLLTSIMTPFFVLFLGLTALREWRRSADRMRDRQDASVLDQLAAERDSGGYIVQEMPEERKHIFRDLLNGFEEYAKLKGYKVSVSIDASMAGKVAYKINIEEHGVTKSSGAVKQDLDDYITDVQSGESRFKDLPKVIQDIEHDKTTMALRNRISYLENNYEVEKNIREFFESFVKSMPQASLAHSVQPVQIYNGNLGMGDNRSYEANNSVGVAQGEKNATLIEGSNINIGGSHAEKTEIINKLDELLAAIKGDEVFTDAARNIANVKEELEEAKEPDVSRIQKWLGKAKSAFDMAEEGGEVMQKAKEAYEAIGQAFT